MVFRNRYNVLLLACALFFTLAGCRREVEPSGLNDGYAVIVEALLPQIGDQVGSKVGSKVGTDSRATGEIAFEKGSQVGMYVISRSATNVAGTLVHIDTPLEGDEDVYNSNYYANASGSLVRVPLEFYPKFEDEARKVDIYGYHPFDDAISAATVMTAYPFEVLANQSTAADFLNSDFMWAKNIRGKEADGVVPAAAAVAMVFAHKMSRVDVWLTLPLISSTGKTLDASVLPSNVRFFGVQRGAVMNLTDGVVATGSEVAKKGDMIPNVVAAGVPGGAVYKYSFVAPAQAFTAGDSFFSCEVTYDDETKGNIIYRAKAEMFGATHKLTTQTGKYHRLNLTLLDPIELTLTGSTIAPWTPGAVVEANLNSKVTTKFSATLKGVTVADGGINRVVVTTDVEGRFDLSVGVTYTGGVCSFEFGGGRSPRDYGFRITKLDFYKGDVSVVSSAVFTSARVYNPISMNIGDVGVLAPPVPITGGIWIPETNVHWATGNLVADGSTGSKIGAPTDGGLYFQFGGLVGWWGGASGDGTGTCTKTGEGTSNVLTVMVKPTELSTTPTAWNGPNNAGGTIKGVGVFNYSTAPYDAAHQDIRSFDKPLTGVAGLPTSGTLGSGRYAKIGVGDACTYYLGGKWRLPTAAEYKTLFDNVGNGTAWGSTGGWGWNTSPNSAYKSSIPMRFPASGFRDYSNGSFSNVSSNGYGWSSSVCNADTGYSLRFHSGSVYPQRNSRRSYGFPVRCVSSR